MNIGIVIQARYGSARFPGKMLAKLAGKSVLERVVSEVSGQSWDVVVAAADPQSYREATRLACYVHYAQCREEDVLRRVWEVADAWKFDAVVRVCGDNPLIDQRSIAQVGSAINRYGTDYVGYLDDNGFPAILQPNGYIAEAVTAAALCRANAQMPSDHPDREHVTKWIYEHDSRQHKGGFRCHWLPLPYWLTDVPVFPAAVDTPDDLRRIEEAIT